MVPMEFDSFCGDNSRTVCDEVSTHCDSGSVGVIFFRTDSADDVRAGDFLSRWHLMLVNEEDCIGAFDSSIDALSEAAQFICTRISVDL